MRHLLLVGTLVFCGCLDTSLPTPPVLGPGTVRATVVTAQPGRSELTPAAGVTVTLVGSTLKATSDADGNVLLTGLTVTKGRLLFSLDLDKDGVAERSRLISLEDVRAGFGRDVNLGQLVLGRNATLVGFVKRGDRVTLPSGHGGISVFLPQLPQLTFTGDDGAFVLGGVPEGKLVLNAWADGYRAEAAPVDLGPSREERVGTLVLEPSPGANPVGRLSGVVRLLSDDSPVAAVRVRAASGGRETQAETSAEGRFTYETLPSGVYSLALEKVGLEPVRADGVLVAPGLNDVGPFFMREGSGVLRLDGGPPLPPGDAGLGVDAGTPDAGAGDAGADAGLDGGLQTDGGLPEPDAGLDGGPDASVPGPDAGTDGGLDAGPGGGPDAGVDAGPLVPDAGSGPLAFVGPPQIVPANSVVTLNGMPSTGDFPLSYSWRQLSGPPVNLNQNDSVTAHSPIFRATDAGVVFEFGLVVTDRFGRASTNSAVARVGVGSTPVARFTPDGGLVFGGQTIPLLSTSFDDGGLVLPRHDWRLGANAQASLVTDGGPTAWITFDPKAANDPDSLSTVELQVTNAIGATSAPFSRTFTVRSASQPNWSLTVTPIMAVLVGPSPPTITLNATLTLPSGAPTPTLSWSCTPNVPLQNPTSLSPFFIAPPVTGPPLAVSCTVLATGGPPLVPSMLATPLSFTLLDNVNPSLVQGLVDPTRLGIWGNTLRMSEPVTGGILSGSCSPPPGYAVTMVGLGSYLVPRPNDDFATSTLCTNVRLDNVTDRAGNALVPAPSLSGNARIRVLWEGPFVSTDQFDDPRPVVAAVSEVPMGTYEVAQVPSPVPPGAELLASRPGELIRFSEFDPDVVDAGCLPSCALSTSTLPVPWISSGAVQTRRLFTRGASMFVAFTDDAGIPALLERSPGGSWGARLTPPGRPIQSLGQLEALSYDGGAIDRWRWDTTARAWNATERVASGLSGAEELAGNERQVTAFIGPTRQLAIWTFGVNTSVSPLSAWYQVPTPIGPPTAGVNASFTNAGVISGFFYNRPNGSLGLYRTGDPINSFVFQPTRDFTFGGSPTAVVQGYDSVTRGNVIVAVRAENGDIRLSLMTYGNWGGGVDQPFEGPTRPGPPPYPQVLDVNPVCEAAWPRLALVNDAVIVTWQERCAPETRWRVVMRLVR